MKLCSRRSFVPTILCFLFAPGLFSPVWSEAQPIYDVTEPPYNTVPDDANDDTDAINDAIDDVAASGTRGIVYLPAGTYRTSSSPISPSDGVILRGAGMDQTIIFRTDQSGHAIEPPLGGVIDLVIEDLTVDSSPSQGIRIETGDNVVIQRARVKDAGDYGIGLQNGP